MQLNNNQQQKVTGLIVILFLNTIAACTRIDNTDERLAFQQRVDSISSTVIDSAYRQINARCDSLQFIRIPILVDSMLKADTLNEKIVADTP